MPVRFVLAMSDEDIHAGVFTRGEGGAGFGFEVVETVRGMGGYMGAV